MDLMTAQIGTQYSIRQILTEDEALNKFLFSLGCYTGEPITVVSRRRSNCIIAVKNGRYSIDRQLASAIIVQEAAI